MHEPNDDIVCNFKFFYHVCIRVVTYKYMLDMLLAFYSTYVAKYSIPFNNKNVIKRELYYIKFSCKETRRKSF